LTGCRYEFDLAARDHREAARWMIRMAAIETGENVRPSSVNSIELSC
jgi:hypothetical protein